MIRLVGVHGIGNYLPDHRSALDAARAKSKDWQAALEQSRHLLPADSIFEVKVAYYAQHLQRAGRQGAPDLEEDSAAMWAEYVADYLPQQPQGPIRAALHAATARLARALSRDERATVAFLELFFREVAVFLRIDGDFTPKHHVLTAVGSALHGADVVVAHSLGSIVAYEALWKYRTEVPLLITLGSPLAMPMIFPRLTPRPVENLGSRPPGVKQWINIADPEDFVAIPHHGVSQRFTNVDEDCHDSVDTILRHEVDRYLQGAEIGRTLTTFARKLAGGKYSDGSI